MLSQDTKKLISWYQSHQRELPWRRNSDAYPVIVSEFMLQQTTVAAVIPKFETWLSRFPDFKSLAEASLQEVMAYWSGLGYYQRARRLHKLAQEVTALGFVPDNVDGLANLTGVGDYTAAAVGSICFERPRLAIDTNVSRVLFRYYALALRADEKVGKERVRDLVSNVWEWCHPGDFNQALMELGASFCSVREPECTLCPLRRGCQGRKVEGGPTQFPLPKVKKKAKPTPGKAFVLQRGREREFVLLRGTGLGLLRDLYQPPLAFAESAEKSQVLEIISTLLPYRGSPTLEWSVKYGISGRILQLSCSAWSLCDSDFAEILIRFRKSQFEATSCTFPPGGKDSNPKKPISSLTRKILEKVLGSS